MLEPGERPNVVHRPATVGSVAEALHAGGTFRVGSMPERRDWGGQRGEAEDFTEGFGEGEVGTQGAVGGDYFAALGKEKVKKPKEDAINPDKVRLRPQIPP
jgi:hypothetical protein